MILNAFLWLNWQHFTLNNFLLCSRRYNWPFCRFRLFFSGIPAFMWVYTTVSPQKLQSYFWLTPRHEPLADNLETPQTPLNDGFVVIAGLPQALNLLVPNYTPLWREALWDWCVLPKNTTQCPRPGLKPELLKLVASACTNLEATTQQPVVGYIT